MMYKEHEIDDTMIPGFYTVVYIGDEIVFDTIEDAKNFIDSLDD